MKKTNLAIIVFSLATSTTLLAQANTTPTATAPAAGSSAAAPNHPDGQKHPCAAVEKACKAAGFVRGGYKTGKGLFKNCMQPIISGQSVSGVTVNPAEIQACKEKHEQHQQK